MIIVLWERTKNGLKSMIIEFQKEWIGWKSLRNVSIKMLFLFLFNIKSMIKQLSPRLIKQLINDWLRNILVKTMESKHSFMETLRELRFRLKKLSQKMKRRLFKKLLIMKKEIKLKSLKKVKMKISSKLIRFHQMFNYLF